MRVLVVGAGAIGGYFGARLLETGCDVTFLVRPRRAAQLARGLSIVSRFGNIDLASPPKVTADSLRGSFDLLLLTCKAYDLDGAMDALAPTVGPRTAILPLRNGMRHLDLLSARFGAERALGGQCMISTVLDLDGRVVHLNDPHLLAFGELDGSRSARVEAIASILSGARFDARPSEAIFQEMWEKWVFIAAGAGITCLMRAAVGDIVTAGAADLAATLLDECAAIAKRQGYASPSLDRAQPRYAHRFGLARDRFDAAGHRSSARVEADHILGDLLARAGQPAEARSLLQIAYSHVKAYEARRAREQASAARAA